MKHFTDLLPLASDNHILETPVSQMSPNMKNIMWALQGCSVGCNQQGFQVTGLGSPDVTHSIYTFGAITLIHFIQDG